MSPCQSRVNMETKRLEEKWETEAMGTYLWPYIREKSSQASDSHFEISLEYLVLSKACPQEKLFHQSQTPVGVLTNLPNQKEG